MISAEFNDLVLVLVPVTVLIWKNDSTLTVDVSTNLLDEEELKKKKSVTKSTRVHM